mgnify:CR=1 FL=1
MSLVNKGSSLLAAGVSAVRGEFEAGDAVDVIDESGKEWGKVVDVLQLPAQDTLVVLYDGKEVLVPFVRAYVPEVDIEAKRLTIINFAGLL